MKKIFVAGVNGLLGQAFLRYANKRGLELLGVSRSSFEMKNHIVADVLEPKTYRKELESFNPDLIVNCVALVDLGQCEKDPELANALNAESSKILASISRELDVRFVQVSTDHLYDGSYTSYAEDDPVSPMNVYGKSKLLGEEMASLYNPQALIVRTNIVGPRGDAKRPTFSEWLNTSLKNRDAITLFTNFITSSAHVDDVVELSIVAADKGVTGILNIAARDSTSKYEFGMLFAKAMGYNTSNVSKGEMMGGELFPPRPSNLSLNCELAEKLLSVSLPTVGDTIKRLKSDFGG